MEEIVVLQKHGINGEIDEEISTLVDEMNRMGLKTVSCCSGHPENGGQGMAQICFLAKDITVLMHGGTISINWKRHTISKEE